MRFWVARDKCSYSVNQLNLYAGDAPIRDGEKWIPNNGFFGFGLHDDDPIGEELTWEHEPREIILVDILIFRRMKEKLRERS